MTALLWLSLAASVAAFAPLAMTVSGLYEPQGAFDGWAAHAMWLGLFLALGSIVARRDRWLGAAVVLVGANVALRHGDLTSCILVALMALGLSLAAISPSLVASWRHRAIFFLSGAALLQALYALQQWLGYDFLMGVTSRTPDLRIVGTLGNPDKVGAFLAILGPLLPWWGLPIIGAAIIATHSLGALLGFAVALMIRYRHSYSAVVVGVTASLATTIVVVSKGGFATASGRLEIWLTGLRDLGSAPIIGHGLGAWSARIPALQISAPNLTTAHGLWTTAHSEVVQWIYETGALGAIVLAAWMWDHRRAVLVPSVAALVVVSLTFHPFHTPALAMAGIAVLALAFAPPAPTLTEGV